MAFGLYIDTDNVTGSGGDVDPRAGSLITAVPEHRPEFVVYIDHLGGQPPGQYDRNDTVENGTVYTWLGSAWDAGVNITEFPINGQISYSAWDFEDEEAFLEFSLPKAFLGDPQQLAVELFTAGVNASHALDTAYSDPNVNFPAPDWTPTPTQLSAFTYVGRGFWIHTYVRSDDTVAGKPNVQMSWPLEYQVTGTSKSGGYYFGDHPDDNYPLTRILVVDEAVAGVYDTVYVDLDHNRDFTNDKPLKKYGKYCADKQWRPADDPVACPVYDETSWLDFFDPASGVTSIDYAPNGTWIATGSNDHRILLWDAASGAQVNEFHAHRGRVTSVAWDLAGLRLAAGYADASGRGQHAVVVWNWDGTVAATFTESDGGHTAGVTAVAWDPVGANNRLVSASMDGTAKVWNVGTGLVATLTGHTAAVGTADWGANGIATGSDDGTVRLWDASWTEADSVAHGTPLNAIAFSPNGTWLAYGDRAGLLSVWDVVLDAWSTWSIPEHQTLPITSVSWSPVASQLLTTSTWDEETNNFVLARWTVNNYNDFFVTGSKTGQAAHEASVFSGTWSTDGLSVVSGGEEARARRWTSATLSLEGDYKGHALGSTDYTWYLTGDGVPDVSGGIIYFIAQNEWDFGSGTLEQVPIPYSDVWIARQPAVLDLQNIIPANGTVVAFMGALDLDQGHGTLVASSIVGRGQSTYFDEGTMDVPTVGHVIGFAPDALLVPVANVYATNFYDGWYFSVEGYDGTPNTGDEAHIISNSFGFSGTYHDGWDFNARFLDYLVNDHADGNVTITVSSGNSGWGYGTVSTPAASPAVITVGAATDFFYRHLSGLERGLNPTFGEVTPESSRGPTAQGMPDPDVVANGRMAFGSVALNQVDYRPYNGYEATNLWAGTSLASPGAAGMLALAFQAYKEANGAFPNASVARSLLMSGADNLKYDPLVQGAGRVNALRTAQLAAGQDGFLVAPNLWNPGDYQGTRYESFAHLMDPGDSAQETFTVTNVAPAPDTLTLTDAVFQKTSEVNFTFQTQTDLPNDPAHWFLILHGLPLALTGTGVYDKNYQKVAAIDEGEWLNADLLRISYRVPIGDLDPDGDGNTNYSYFLEVMDWSEDDWTMFPPEPNTGAFSDLNRRLIVFPDANVWEGRIHDPAGRTHDGLAMGVRAGIQPGKPGAAGINFLVTLEFYQKADWNWLSLSTGSLSLAGGETQTFTSTVDVPAGTPIGGYEGAIYIQGDPATASATRSIQVPFFASWVSADHQDISALTVLRNGVPQTAGVDYLEYLAAGMVNFTAPLNPGDVVQMDYTYANTTTIPVVINVPSNQVEFGFGQDAPGQDDLFRNRVVGGFGQGTQSGDWRFYFVDVPDQGQFSIESGSKFFLDLQWDLDMTDINGYAFGPGAVPIAAGLTAGAFPQSRYGPYLLYTTNGGSEETATFFTTTGGPEEIVAPGLVGGLNVLAIQNVLMNGTYASEAVSGQVGSMRVNPPEIKVVTNELSGSRDVLLYSSVPWPGIGSVSAGPSAPEEFLDVPIQQDVIEGGTFIDLLVGGSYTKVVNVEPSALIFDVHITSNPGDPPEGTAEPCDDLDLALFLDGKGPDNVPDGAAQVEEFVVYDADADADEHIRLIKPTVQDDPDTPEVNEGVVGAPYIIKVLGFTCPKGFGTFNMDLTLVQGEGFTVAGTTAALIPAWNVSTVTLQWNLDGSTPDGELLGALYVGPEKAPLTLLIPVELAVDRVAPVIEGFSLNTAPGLQIENATQLRTNDPMPRVAISFSDAERGELSYDSVRLWLDGQDMTPQAEVVIPFGLNAEEKLGYWQGAVTFGVPAPLLDGPHFLTVAVGDEGGNVASQSFVVVIDTQSPPLTLDDPDVSFTNQGTHAITGASRPGSTVEIPGGTVEMEADGTFRATVTLAEGANVFEVRSVPWYSVDGSGNPVPANVATVEKTIVYDALAPAFDQALIQGPNPTRTATAPVTGRVSDLIAAGTPWDPTTLAVTVAGRAVAVNADGSFETLVPLVEGPNVIPLTATDLAGNTASVNRTVILDTLAPSLSLEAVPETTNRRTLTIEGQTELSAVLTLNGGLVVTAAGAFTVDVELSRGANVLVVAAEDVAGNRVERRLVVEYRPEAGPDLLLWVLAPLLLVVGLLLGFFVGPRVLGPRGPEEEEPEEAEPEELPEEDERIARLREAYESGRITEEVYEENLARLAGEAPEEEAPAEEEEIPPEEEEEEPPEEDQRPPEEEEAIAPEEEEIPEEAVPAEEDPLARLEAAFAAGRISREVYEQNRARLTGAPPAEEEAAEEELEEPPEEVEEPLATEDQVTRLQRAFEAGRISEAVYRENLARIGVEAPEEPEEEAVEPEEEVPEEDERVLRVQRAYEAGKISRDVYEKNLALMGFEVPEEAVDLGPLTRLAEAFAAGRVSGDLFTQNLGRLELPDAELPNKVERLSAAYEAGKISETVFRENVKRLLK